MNDENNADAASADAASADAASATADAATESGAESRASGGGNTRLLLLLLVLAVACGALYWDRKVAKPTSEQMIKKLEDAAMARNSSTEPPFNPADVSETLGRPPSSTEEGEHYVIETFKWRGGLPWKSYDIHVVYSKQSGGPSFRTAYYMTPPDPEYMPGYTPPPPPAATDDAAEAMAGEGLVDGGDEGGGDGADDGDGEAADDGGPAPGGAGRPSPEAIVERVFTESDADGDGTLSAEEIETIEGRRKQLVESADANEDGVVDRDELTAAAAARQAAGGGPRGGGDADAGDEGGGADADPGDGAGEGDADAGDEAGEGDAPSRPEQEE